MKSEYKIVIIIILTISVLLLIYPNLTDDTSGDTGETIEAENITFHNASTNIYSGYGVNFYYPSNWNASTINNDGYMILISKDQSDSSPLFEVQIFSNDGVSDQEAIKVAIHSFNPNNSQDVSNNTLIIDNLTAYENTFTINSSKDFNSIMTLKEINIIKNGTTYRIIMQAPANDFNNEQNNYNLMLNSFKIL